jgi:hypothetical protein
LCPWGAPTGSRGAQEAHHGNGEDAGDTGNHAGVARQMGPPRPLGRPAGGHPVQGGGLALCQSRPPLRHLGTASSGGSAPAGCCSWSPGAMEAAGVSPAVVGSGPLNTRLDAWVRRREAAAAARGLLARRRARALRQDRHDRAAVRAPGGGAWLPHAAAGVASTRGGGRGL